MTQIFPLYLRQQAIDIDPNRKPKRPDQRQIHDLVLFYIILPLLFSVWAAAIGMPPADQLSFSKALIYIFTQVLAAWWANALAATLVSRIKKNMPLWLILLAGFWLAWLPLILFYYLHGAFFRAQFPEMAAPMVNTSVLEYSWKLVRYSTPFLPLWMIAVYGYLFFTKAPWFDSEHVITPKPNPDQQQPPAVLIASKLPAEEDIIALKADEHYLHIWSPGGHDIVRYRFQDAVEELSDWPGQKVHRSWWINWNYVTSWNKRGHSIKLQTSNTLDIPVSLTHKAEALAALKERRIA